jgi:cytochrome c-type biogenesis protein CcmH/NrfF
MQEIKTLLPWIIPLLILLLVLWVVVFEAWTVFQELRTEQRREDRRVTELKNENGALTVVTIINREEEHGTGNS